MKPSNAKIEQIKAIKERLNKAVFRDLNINANKLARAIADRDDLYDVSYNTLSAMLDLDSTALDLYAVIATCRCLNLDTAYIMSPPGTPEPLTMTERGYEKFSVLDDPRYLGKFYGYLYTPNPERNEIIRFELEIKEVLNTTTATLTYHGKPVDVHNQVQDDTRVLHGTPYRDNLHANISIQFTNDMGDYYFFYYTHQRLRSHDLYFRRGVAITASSVTTTPPLLQNFVLFALEVPQSKMHFIPGLLADVSPVFHITEDRMKELCAEYAIVETFYENFKHILEHDSQRVYPISEAVILSSPSPKMGKYDIAKALLLLKGASIEPSRHVFDELDTYGAFSKVYLQQPD